jgi:hypothetical protein
MDPASHDAQLRQAAFSHVDRLATLHGGVLDSADLAGGPQTRMSAGCGFRKETIVGMRRNGRDAQRQSIARSAIVNCCNAGAVGIRHR